MVWPLVPPFVLCTFKVYIPAKSSPQQPFPLLDPVANFLLPELILTWEVTLTP